MWTAMRRIFLTLGALLAIGVLISIYWIARGGAFKSIENDFNGSCSSFPLEGSAEDILIDHERGYAYLSILDRMGVAQGRPPAPGMIGRLDLNVNPPVLSNALTSTTEHMAPHGISLYIGKDGVRTLFMINHPADRANGTETINRYVEMAPGQFALTDTLSHPAVISPNDLVAVGPRQVYVVNDKGAEGTLDKMQEQLFGKGYSKLVYFDGDEGRIVLDDVASGGGINVSPDGSKIYIAQTGGMNVRVLERNPLDGSLTDQQLIELESAPDNIDIAADGNLTVATHADLMALIQHFISGQPAPSQVFAIDKNTDGDYAVEQIYLNTGEEISAGSVGATFGNQLLIGSITSRQVLICERDM